MDTTEVKKTVQIRLVGGDTVTGLKSWSGTDTILIFTPDSLRADTTYSVKLFATFLSPDSCKDIADSTLDGNRNGVSQGSPTLMTMSLDFQRGKQ